MDTEAEVEYNGPPFWNAATKNGYSNLNNAALYAAAIEKELIDEDEGDEEKELKVAGYNQWLELGRRVKPGEHGVPIMMVVKKKVESKKKGRGKKKDEVKTYPKTVTVFFEAQTEDRCYCVNCEGEIQFNEKKETWRHMEKGSCKKPNPTPR